MRRRLIKRVVVACQLEPHELSALCALLAAGIREVDADQLRSRLDEVRNEHIEIVELEYSDVDRAGLPGEELIEQEWRLAVGQIASSTILPFEAEVMVDRLEEFSTLHQGEGATEEVDIIGMLAAAAARRFGGDLPQDSTHMELMVTHLLGALDSQLQQDWHEPSAFRRRQILGVMAQRILNQTPRLISSIAQSAGPMLAQVEARSQGRNPGEVIQHLFMRTPDQQAPAQEAGHPPGDLAQTPAARRQTRREPLDPSSLVTKMPNVTPAEALSVRIDPPEIMSEFLDVLVRWIVHEESASQRESAVDYLHEFIAREINAPSRALGQEILALLTGSIADELTPALRQELFSGLDCHALLMYLQAALPDRQDFVGSLRAARQVLGEPFVRETIRCCVGRSAKTVGQPVIAAAAQALAAQMAPAIARDARNDPLRMVRLALAVVEHLDPLEQAQLLSVFLGVMGSAAPMSLALRLARVPGAPATPTLREWTASIDRDTRQVFADLLLGERGIAGIELTVDIAAGERPWRKMYPQRERAIRALAGAPPARARASLSRLARFGRWSPSPSKRALARLAREALETTNDRETSPPSRNG